MEIQATPLVMGILNVTPDSFADGGKYNSLPAALEHAHRMVEEGAAIIDVGGESTRPGAERIGESEELDRTIPVIEGLRGISAHISIDTTRASVAKAAIAAGATYINDVSGGLADPAMASLVAHSPQIQYIAMHWRGHSKTMNSLAQYSDVVSEVRTELEERASDLLSKGVQSEQLILDPGIGFAKDAGHNWEILRNLDRFSYLGYPILVGASRKRFLGELIGSSTPSDRDVATVALTALLVKYGIWGVRTHSVRPHVEAIAVAMEMAKR
jgi:dihydropteroate synthase